MRRLIIVVAATAAMLSFASAQTVTTTEMFMTANSTDVLSYNLIGLNVVDSQNNVIGEVKDIVVSGDKLSGYIVSVGGFLGIGEKYVIARPEALNISYSESDKKWNAMMNATKEILETAPEFKYEGRWEK